MTKNLENYLEEINQSLFSAKSYYEMWWVLSGDKTRPKYVKVMNQYNYCSRTLIGATFDSAIVALYKVLENRDDSYNFYRMLSYLKDHKNFDSKDIEHFSLRLSTHEKTIKGIKILRNNVVGHSSKTLLYKAAFKKAGIKPNNWKLLIQELVNIICDIYEQFDNRKHTTFYTSKPSQELEKLLTDLSLFHKLES